LTSEEYLPYELELKSDFVALIESGTEIYYQHHLMSGKNKYRLQPKKQRHYNQFYPLLLR
jgi:hypothetical protein